MTLQSTDAERSSQSIHIDALPAEVMSAIADFEQYPSWAGSLKHVRVLEKGPDGRAKRVSFSLETGVLNAEYELQYEWSGDERVEWDLVAGQLMRSQHGVYQLAADASGTQVTYTLSVELSVPMLGALKRKAERVVMDTALKELKKYVESRP